MRWQDIGKRCGSECALALSESFKDVEVRGEVSADLRMFSAYCPVLTQARGAGWVTCGESRDQSRAARRLPGQCVRSLLRARDRSAVTAPRGRWNRDASLAAGDSCRWAKTRDRLIGALRGGRENRPPELYAASHPGDLAYCSVRQSTVAVWGQCSITAGLLRSRRTSQRVKTILGHRADRGATVST